MTVSRLYDSRICRWLCNSAALMLMLSAYSVPAHDIDVTGVARLVLQESTNNAYRLSLLDFQAPPLTALEQIIPARCSVDSAGAYAGDFHCSSALNYNDSLVLPWSLSGVVLLARWQDGREVSAYFRGNGARISIPLAELQAAAGSRLDLSLRYLKLGIEHILFGMDHLLFVFGLLLLLRGFWKLVQTVTAFTLAHSLTLACAVLGYLPIPRAPVETVIALSIVLLAREIIMAERGRIHLVHRQPWVVAFLFGLFHGFGFAGALGDLGLRGADIPFALLFFNLGVESGQLLFIAALLLGFTLYRRIPVLAQRLVTHPLREVTGYALGGVAMFWFLQRLPSVLLL